MNLTKTLLNHFDQSTLREAERQLHQRAHRIYKDTPEEIRSVSIESLADTPLRTSLVWHSPEQIWGKCSCEDFFLGKACVHLAVLALDVQGKVFETRPLTNAPIHFQLDLPNAPKSPIGRAVQEWIHLFKKDLRQHQQAEESVPAADLELWYGLDFKAPGPVPGRLDQPVGLFYLDKGKLKPFYPSQENIQRLKNQDDLALISFLRFLTPTSLSPYWRQKLGRQKKAVCFLPFDGLLPTLRLIAKTGRLFIKDPADALDGPPTPVHFAQENQIRLTLNIGEVAKDRYQLELTPASSRWSSLKGRSFLIDLERGLMSEQDRLFAVTLPPLPLALSQLSKTPLPLSAQELDAIMDLIEADPYREYGQFFELSSQKRPNWITATPTALFQIQVTTDKQGSEFRGRLMIHYPEYSQGLFSPLQEGNLEGEQQQIILRDWEFEEEKWRQIHELEGLTALPTQHEASFHLDPSALLSLVQEFADLHIPVYIDQRRVHPARHYQSSIRPEGDWFEIRSKADFDLGADQTLNLNIADVLQHTEEHPLLKLGLIQLGDGNLGLLPEDWLQKQMALFHLAQVEGESTRLHQSQAMALEALLEQDRDQLEHMSWGDLRARAREALHPEQVQLSPHLNVTLRDYQREGLAWLLYLHQLKLGGVLADDMGLGKTLQALAFLEHLRHNHLSAERPHLVLVPRTLLYNWQKEARSFTPKLKLFVYDGTPEQRKKLRQAWSELNDGEVVLMTYGTLRRDVLLIRELSFDCLLLDEAQVLQNSETLTFKAVRTLKAQSRFALSGTPAQNRLSELTSLMRLLVPKIFAKKMPVDTLDQADAKLREQVLRGFSAFILRRTKDEVLKELPEKIETLTEIELPPDHARFYLALKRHYQEMIREGKAQQFQVLEALLRLRQAACHPRLVDKNYKGSSGKFLSLIHSLKEIQQAGGKALVFSQFTQLLKLLQEELNEAQLSTTLLTGQTKNREAVIESFESDPEQTVFLLSIKAGGVGVTLTSANYVFILDPWWNPSVEAQAIDRAYRLGQKKTVFSYKLFSKATVEEKILELQGKKLELIDQIQTQSDFAPEETLELMNLFMDS